MAKRRTRPIENPIRHDLIAEIARPVDRTPQLPREAKLDVPQGQRASTEAALAPDSAHGDRAVGEGGSSGEARSDPAKKQRKTAKPGGRINPREKDPKSRWTERRHVQIKARFVHEEAEEIERLRGKVSDLTRCNISSSHLTRALWSLALQAGDQLDEVADKAPRLRRPPHGHPVATGEFEDDLAVFLLRALKKVRPGG